MSNIGRNDPCPCDSGKKYKKCCLPKIKASPQAHVLDYEQKLNLAIDGIPALDKESNKTEEDSVIKYNELLRELEEFLYSNDVDDESIFEFYESLYSLSCKLDKFDDFFNLTLKLKERHPEIYQEEEKYILCSWIDAKLRLGQISEACEAFIEFCHVCDHGLDIFYPEMNKLLYYGCHETILQGIDIIWPKVEGSDLFDWAIEELKLKYCQLSCFAEFLNSVSPRTKSNIVNKLSNFDLDENDLDYATKVFDILLSNKAIESENISTSIKSLDGDDSLHNLIHGDPDANPRNFRKVFNHKLSLTTRQH